MRRLFEHIRRYFKAYLITFIISAAIGLAIFLTYYFIHKSKFIGAMDGSGVASAALAGIAVLIWIGKLGAYDSMSYGFKQMFSSMFGKNPSKYNDFASYKEEKSEQRESGSKLYFATLLVSLIFAIIFIIYFIIYKTL